MKEEEIIKELCNKLDGYLVNDRFCVVKFGYYYPEMQIRKGVRGIWIGFYHKSVEKDIAGNEFSNVACGGVFDQLYGGEFDSIDCVGTNPTICELKGKDNNVTIFRDSNDDKEEVGIMVRHKGTKVAHFHLIKELEENG